MLRRRYHLSAPGQRRQWTEGAKRLRFLCDAGTMHYPDQSIAKPNEWTTDGERQQRESVRGFWNAFQRLRHI
jgi:RNA-directed DNA polymerase